MIASNDDGYLPGNRRNFLIRENLAAGVYYVKVSSFAERSDGPYSVYAAAITEPGSALADAQPTDPRRYGERNHRPGRRRGLLQPDPRRDDLRDHRWSERSH